MLSIVVGNIHTHLARGVCGRADAPLVNVGAVDKLPVVVLNSILKSAMEGDMGNGYLRMEHRVSTPCALVRGRTSRPHHP